MKILNFLSLVFLLSTFACTPLQNTHSPYGPSNAKPGSCYAKCLQAVEMDVEEVEYPVYTGTNTDDPNLKKVKLILEPGSTKWVKKKADRNCISADPNDCLVWCLVEVPGKNVDLLTVKDTTQMPGEYVWETYQLNYGSTGAVGQTEWKEVLCNEKVTSDITMQIQQALMLQQFYSGDMTGRLDSKTKAALSSFQKRNGLPIGNLDFETLDALAVSY